MNYNAQNYSAKDNGSSETVYSSSHRLRCVELVIAAGITGAPEKIVQAAKVLADFIYARELR